jgi:hypothetical protein
MDDNYPTDEVAATPEYVLELFREALLDSDEDIDLLTFETTVSEFAFLWNDLCFFWWEFAKPLNEITGLDLPIDEWKPVLYPMRKRRLSDVCDYVASRMGSRPAIRPWHYIGGDCLPAGAFLATRSILARYGADAKQITPSTSLVPHFEHYGFHWLWDLRRLAPRRLPRLVVDRWFPTCGCLIGLATGGVPMLLGAVSGKDGGIFWAIGSLILFFTFFISIVVHRLSRKNVELGNLATFRDLSYALAGQQPRRRIQPSS